MSVPRKRIKALVPTATQAPSVPVVSTVTSVVAPLRSVKFPRLVRMTPSASAPAALFAFDAFKRTLEYPPAWRTTTDALVARGKQLGLCARVSSGNWRNSSYTPDTFTAAAAPSGAKVTQVCPFTAAAPSSE